MRRTISIILLYVFFSLFIFSYADDTHPKSDELIWAETDQSGKTKLNLYFFWSKKCPHCLEAQPFVEKLPKKHDWLTLKSFELSQHPENVILYESIAQSMKLSRISVPAFMFCGNVMFGFDSEQTTGKYLIDNLKSCLAHATKQLDDISAIHSPKPKETPLTTPLFGELKADSYSLPVFTLIIALMDAFNPCAFFVL